ncbi:MAG: RHS repeat domain-containing protein [Opitutales bacterium]
MFGVALAGGLRGGPAAATSYETGRPYYLGMGDLHVPVPGAMVDLPTGAVRIHVSMLPIPGRYSPTVGWYFTSQDASSGPVGIGTSLGTDYVMQVPSSSVGLDLIAPGHRCFHFDYNFSDGLFHDNRDPEMLGATFAQGAQTTAGTLTLKDGEQLVFTSGGGNSPGSVTQMQDRYGNGITVGGSGASLLGSYYPRVDYSWSGYQISGFAFSYTTGNPPGRAWSLTYDGSNRLSSVADPTGGAWHYTWTTYTRGDGQVLPLISTITSPRGYTVLAALYDLEFRLMGGKGAIRPRSEPPDGEGCGYEETMPCHHPTA